MFLCLRNNNATESLRLLDDALTCARKSSNEILLCFVVYLRWCLLGNEADKEVELEKMQSILSQLPAPISTSTSELDTFLRDMNAVIVKQQGKISLPAVNNEYPESFRFMQALQLLFFYRNVATQPSVNLIELVEVVAKGCKRIRGCRVERLVEFLAEFAESLNSKENSSEYERVIELIATMKAC